VPNKHQLYDELYNRWLHQLQTQINESPL
jgi:hypothetical protein